MTLSSHMESVWNPLLKVYNFASLGRLSSSVLMHSFTSALNQGTEFDTERTKFCYFQSFFEFTTIALLTF